MPLNNPAHIIHEVKRLVESDRRSEIRLSANGGNSVLIVCDPIKELEYITHLEKLLPEDNYSIIDLNKCLMNFISAHKAELIELYNLLQSATHEIFKAPAGEESKDLFKEIIEQITRVLSDGKVPVLINTGALYGTGIHNIHIMENDVVMKATLPVIILYPATIEPDRIMFLGKYPASKYRCMIVQ
ncbi:hypothetical protein [Agriterribacter sp.]|uniref:hypothetical protein n=1 Tax=Agriterribacter sp. TaxID=2821509 RepID=UPI002CDA4913|nr:hypothetical protein [Agriterribacter sp.]HRN49163.1 hypothetical protein [Niabella sp.]HRO46475.1 hypothetical protein [Agriterribacter sp.]HRQ17374.1 hypothetical protein [Agriterribacter sp.]